jgi:hypothetical protein
VPRQPRHKPPHGDKLPRFKPLPILTTANPEGIE